MPVRARREALKSALLSKCRDGEVVVVHTFGLQGPKTKALAGLLDAAGHRKSCLIVTHERDENLLKSVNNLPRVATALVDDINAYDLLLFRGLVITEGALAKLKEKNGAA